MCGRVAAAHVHADEPLALESFGALALLGMPLQILLLAPHSTL